MVCNYILIILLCQDVFAKLSMFEYVGGLRYEAVSIHPDFWSSTGDLF